MSTISKERLEQLASGNAWVCVQDDEAAELARIALASLEAEPAIHRWRRVTSEPYGPYPWHYGDFIGFSKPVDGIEDEYFYTAPPAPVSVPDEDLLHMAASAIDDLLSNKDRSGAGVWADIPAKLRRAAMLQGAEPDFRETSNSSTKHFRENAETSTKCWCRTCRPVTISDMRFVVCPECGNKRCPHANDHRNACTGSNEPGQEGSAYPAAPQQEAQ